MDEFVRTAAEAMLTTPVRHPPSATVREIRDFFRDDHVHAALIVSPAGYLEAVVERDDIVDCQAPGAAAAPLGRLAGRTVAASANLADVRRAMTVTGRRRAAVTSADGRLLGLLCLKASRTGFCSDRDVRARARSRGQLETVVCVPQITVSRSVFTCGFCIVYVRTTGEYCELMLAPMACGEIHDCHRG